MNIPNLLGNKLVKENGDFTSDYHLWFSNLVTQLQQGVSNFGFTIPGQPSSTIDQLNSMPVGTFVFDSDNGQLKVKIS
jgi:hypothetical protein